MDAEEELEDAEAEEADPCKRIMNNLGFLDMEVSLR